MDIKVEPKHTKTSCLTDKPYPFTQLYHRDQIRTPRQGHHWVDHITMVVKLLVEQVETISIQLIIR